MIECTSERASCRSCTLGAAARSSWRLMAQTKRHSYSRFGTSRAGRKSLRRSPAAESSWTRRCKHQQGRCRTARNHSRKRGESVGWAMKAAHGAADVADADVFVVAVALKSHPTSRQARNERAVKRLKWSTLDACQCLSHPWQCCSPAHGSAECVPKSRQSYPVESARRDLCAGLPTGGAATAVAGVAAASYLASPAT